MQKFYLYTFGCQANERDSEMIAGMLGDKGFQAAKEVEEADVILFNTCCVREKAEHKVFSRLGELKELKSRNPRLLIGVCGCMTQQENMPAKIRRRAPHVDLILGTHNLHELPEMIDNIRLLNTPQVHVLPDRAEIKEGLPSQREFPFKALVNITFGCNNFCTYCIVPYVRGREKSRQPEDVLHEIRKIADDGVVEVMLLGQNVNSYGKDLNPALSFAALLEQVEEVPEIRRVRYMTSHPRDFSMELIETIGRLKKVCRHFHLPVQSGSDEILRRMNRGYTRDEYIALVNNIKKRFPEASLTTDIIVGFPGETAEDFQQTLDLVESVRFDSAYTFVYSARSGTPAAKMEGQVPEKEKRDRLQKLMALQNDISLQINRELKDKRLQVLVEGSADAARGLLSGRTDTNKTVIFAGPENLIGRFADVTITSPQTWILKGML